MLERKRVFGPARFVVVAAVLGLADTGNAQPGGAESAVVQEAIETVPAGGAMPAAGGAESGAGDVAGLVDEGDDLDVLEQVDEAEVPSSLTPLTTYVVTDEITVRGLRPGDIRKRLWDLDTEIEKTVVSFFRQLNDVIVDPQYHVRCVRVARRSPSPGFNSRIMERRCYAGFQIDELESMTALGAGGGAYTPNDNWLLRKEQEYSDIVMQAIAEIPSLAVAAEELVRMQEERLALTGGEPSLSIAQYERQLARERFLAQFERLEQRRQRKAEREAEREARRQDDAD